MRFLWQYDDGDVQAAIQTTWSPRRPPGLKAFAGMNCEFLDPLGTVLPKSCVQRLSEAVIFSAAFSSCGRYLAAGSRNGVALIYDLLTGSKAMELHTGEGDNVGDDAFGLISFSQQNEMVAAAHNQSVVVWCCLQRTIIGRLNLEKEPKLLAFADDNTLLVVSCDGSVLNCDLGSKSQELIFDPKENFVACSQSKTALAILTESQLTFVACAAPFDVVRYSVSEILGDSAGVLGIACHASGGFIALTLKNRAVLLVRCEAETGEMTVVRKLIDSVDRLSWSFVGFSQHCDFECSFTYACASTKGRHTIYFWNNLSGELVSRMGEGVEEEPGLALWCPTKSQLVTVGRLSGRVYVWSPVFSQSWSALVANIDPLDVNVEYTEQETEFDVFEGHSESLDPIDVCEFVSKGLCA